MRARHAIAFFALIGFASAASADAFHIEDVTSARNADVAQLKPATIAFSDKPAGDSADANLNLARFEDWARDHPNEKKFLALYPSYVEPTITRSDSAKDNAKPGDTKPDAVATKPESAGPKPVVEKLYVYVAQARFVIDRAPDTIDLTRYVTLDFLQRIDPAIKHKLITPGDVVKFTDDAGVGNQNPDRPWCTGRQSSICIQSIYQLEGKIPLGIMLVNKLRESSKKVSDHIDFQSEFSALSPADLDQAGLQQLTNLDTPVSGALEQDIFYVNQIMKFGKFFAVFQNHPTDSGKTVVTAFMTLAIKAYVLEEKRGYEKVPVLRNLVPIDVLMGRSSFNSGHSISAGLPQYARNEIKTVADILEQGAAAK
jgi:hypothetical protein